MFEQLFGSKTRVKLLQLFYTNPNRSFYVREITRKVDEQINSVRRELSNLLGIGIITSDANNNRLYYEVNQDYKFYSALSMIFGGGPTPLKTAKKNDTKATKDKSGESGSQESSQKVESPISEHPLAKDLRQLGNVDLVVFTGQFTRDDSSGVDVLIVGDVNQAKTLKFMTELEKNENKELRYAVMTTENFNYRLQINDRFINNLLNAKKQVIISSQNVDI